MERPTVQKLLDDVRARKIDVIVVYKVDRLTRSLADLAKLVELFDAHCVSFMSFQSLALQEKTGFPFERELCACAWPSAKAVAPDAQFIRECSCSTGGSHAARHC